LYEQKDPEKMLSRIDQRYPAFETVKKIYIALMNYLQVAAGSGEGMSYPLDLPVFCKNFSLDVVEASNAIQILALQGVLSFNETSFQPSTVEFTVNKTDLMELENTHEDLGEIIKGLLRSYEGIFDYPTIINERMLASFTRKSAEAIITHLKKLHHFGIIRYKQSDSSPLVFLIKNRMYHDDFWFDEKTVVKQRKQAHLRAEQMNQYLEEKTRCRNLYISGYFGESSGEPCGICDNCIDQKKRSTTNEEFDQVSGKVISLLKNHSCTIDELFKQMRLFDEKKLWEVVNYLIAENIVTTGSDQKLQVKH
jgi:ATP-dependent DNA helicase RecQ